MITDPGSEPDALLRVSDLTIGFPTRQGEALATNHVGFHVKAGETLGIVGESGCGKSVSLRALLGVVPAPGKVLGGQASWQGERDLLAMSHRQLREIRGKHIGMIFQDPQESLNPVYSIGDQLTEVLRKRGGLARRASHTRAVELLQRVGIPEAERRLRDYPHQLSGGMRQRVMIAIAISSEPELLLADEPTTALDVTIQDQILSLLADLQHEFGMALILVSHDLGVIGQCCDRVAVMYAGRIIESGDVDEVLLSPRHPYTAGLLAAVPDMPGENGNGNRKLNAIRGQAPAITDLPEGCLFAPRCRFVRDDCAAIPMELDAAPGGHRSACPFVNAGDEATVGS